MLKVLILDDEAIARMGLRHAVDWEANGYVVVGEAGSLSDARALLRSQKPDILLVDIRLRNENGLDFIEEARRELPQAKFVIVSCTDEPEYYRKAISLHVSEYISKAEITAEELLNKMNGVARQILQERGASPEAADEGPERRASLDELLRESLQQKQNEPVELRHRLLALDARPPEGAYVAMALLFLQRPPAALTPNVLSLCREILLSIGEGFAFENDGTLYLLLTGPEAASTARQHDLAYRLSATIYECFDLRPSIGVSLEQESLASFSAACAQALRASERKFVDPEVNLSFYQSGLDEAPSSLVYSALQPLLQKELQPRLLETRLENLYHVLRSSPNLGRKIVRHFYESVALRFADEANRLGSDFAAVSGSELSPEELVERCASLPELHETFLQAARRLMEADERDSSLSEQIKRYIQCHLSEDLSLETLSRSFHFSASYISRCFKQETNQNLKAYVMECKLSQAKELLLAGEALGTVAEKLHFCSSSHLIQVFKNYEGMTPGEYCQLFSRREE